MSDTFIRTLTRDRRLTAIHEAGHAVVARWAGVPSVQPSIHMEIDSIRGGAQNAWLDKTWTGKIILFSPIKKLSTRRMIAVAGAVAEGCWKRWDFDDIAVGLEYDPQSMSDTDWAMAGCDPSNVSTKVLNAAADVYSLLERGSGLLWPSLLTEARKLINASRPYLSLPIQLD